MDHLEPAWLPLKLHSGLANSNEDIARNVEYCLSRPYVGLQNLLGTESGAVSVVGSGPSLKRNWMKLRDSDTDIIACNASFQFLLEKGIVPKYMFCFDADPLIYEFFTKHPDVTYLISSRCPPKTWELLEGCNVVVWHTGGDPDIENLLVKHKKNEPMVSGGTAAVTRAMVLAPTLGYTTVHLWGCDSSFSEGDTHIRKSTTDEKAAFVLLNKKVFALAPWMAQQVEDFKILGPALRDRHGIKLIVHGEGILPHLAATMGFQTDESKVKRFLWDVSNKAKILWLQL